MRGFSYFCVEPDFRKFAEALADPHSDARFSLSWMQLSDDVQEELAATFTRGDLEELVHVIQAIARFEESAQHFWGLAYHDGFSYEGLGFFIGPPPSFCLQRWHFHIQNYFGICANQAFTDKHPCVRFCTPRIVVERVPLSQHDRLEAALFLREWAHDKIPPDELSVLLPTL